MAPTAYLEQLEYDARLMNEALKKEVIQEMGNTALLGAKILLFSKPEILDEILLKIKTYQLRG